MVQFLSYTRKCNNISLAMHFACKANRLPIGSNKADYPTPNHNNWTLDKHPNYLSSVKCEIMDSIYLNIICLYRQTLGYNYNKNLLSFLLFSHFIGYIPNCHFRLIYAFLRRKNKRSRHVELDSLNIEAQYRKTNHAHHS